MYIMKAEKHQCSEKVMRDYRLSLCSTNATLEEDGKWYCKKHAPSVIETKHADWQAKFEAKCQLSKAHQERDKVEQEILVAFRCGMLMEEGSDLPLRKKLVSADAVVEEAEVALAAAVEK